LEQEKKHDLSGALDSFKKADKQDGGRCGACQMKMVKYGIALHEWKAAELAGTEMVEAANDKKSEAMAHYMFGLVLLNHGIDKHKDELYSRAHQEFRAAVAAYSSFPDAILGDGRALARLNQDAEAKSRFEDFVKMRSKDDPERQRALRYIDHPELARARMAPNFTITTMEGKRIAFDDLQGKVVLLDFWATWCGPCREALPSIKNLARKFQDQPFVIVSISLDDDEAKWKEFVAKNEMSWPQYCDGGFTGSISRMFGVDAIPHTFLMDGDGVLQDERIGDSSVEGKIKKLIARAQEMQTAGKTRP
jgi:thiol-disulfide isomerase/thioredoxin